MHYTLHYGIEPHQVHVFQSYLRFLLIKHTIKFGTWLAVLGNRDFLWGVGGAGILGPLVARDQLVIMSECRKFLPIPVSQPHRLISKGCFLLSSCMYYSTTIGFLSKLMKAVFGSWVSVRMYRWKLKLLRAKDMNSVSTLHCIVYPSLHFLFHPYVPPRSS